MSRAHLLYRLFVFAFALPHQLIAVFLSGLKLFGVSLDLISYDDCFQSSYEKGAFVEFSLRSICRNPLLGKALLRLPAFYAVFLLISSSDLLSSTTTRFHRCGVTVVIPQVRIISLVFFTVLFCRDCSRRSDKAEGFIYTEPQFS